MFYLSFWFGVTLLAAIYALPICLCMVAMAMVQGSPSSTVARRSHMCIYALTAAPYYKCSREKKNHQTMHAPAPARAINPLIFGPQKLDLDVSKSVFFNKKLECLEIWCVHLSSPWSTNIFSFFFHFVGAHLWITASSIALKETNWTCAYIGSCSTTAPAGT